MVLRSFAGWGGDTLRKRVPKTREGGRGQGGIAPLWLNRTRDGFDIVAASD
jgi:hypothetical protein